MRQRLVFGLASIAVLLVLAGNSLADPSLGNVPPHRHWVETASGTFVEVGPRVCDNPNLQTAFNQFHNNIHAVTPAGIGPAAPGLHNGTGADMTFSGCPILLG
jgi:hypothetical protein